MSKKVVGVVVVVAVVLSLGAAAYAADGLPFSDIAGHWAEEEIASQADRGVVRGHEGGTFGPEEYVTRAQMVVFLDREQELEEAAANAPVEARRGCPDCHQGQYSLQDEASLQHEAIEKGAAFTNPCRRMRT